MTNEEKRENCRCNNDKPKKSERFIEKVRNFADKYNNLIQAIGIGGAVVGIIILIAQTCYMGEQTSTLRSDYEARTRPYLAAGNVTTEQVTSDIVDIIIDIVNQGDLPATRVQVVGVYIGQHIDFDEKTRTILFSYESLTTPLGTPTPSGSITEPNIIGRGLLAPIVEGQFPLDAIFFPGMHHTITARTSKWQYDDTVVEAGLMNVAIIYYSSGKLHYYIGEAAMEIDGKWNVKFHRGN